MQKSDINATDFNIPPELAAFARMCAEHGTRIYAVGGMVRNPLLKLPISDMDICGAMLPENMLALCAQQEISCFEKGVAFGTMEIHLGANKYEYTTFRADKYDEGGMHRPSEVLFASTVQEDAFRRDFTVNAVYLDIISNSIIDPTGGLADINKKIIRATSQDPNIIMRDDGLRILRMVRFAADLGFYVEESTINAAINNIQGLGDISSERIRDELNKIIMSDVRYGAGKESLLNALFMLRDIGALEIILPELYRGRGIEQKKGFHIYDVLDHMLHSCAAAEPRLTLRLAALLHDLGKPVALEASGRMYGHDVLGVELAENLLRRLKYSNEIINTVTQLVRWHMYDLNGTAKDKTLRRKFVTLGYDLSLELAAMREADVHGSGVITGEVKSAKRWRELLAKMRKENVPFDESELACTGEDIMRWLNIQPSPLVGEIKHGLLMHCAHRPRDNKRESLGKIAREMMKNSR